jgi:hypothetical protein
VKVTNLVKGFDGMWRELSREAVGKMAVSLLIRAPDAEAVQESPIILRFHWQRGVRQIR